MLRRFEPTYQRRMFETRPLETQLVDGNGVPLLDLTGYDVNIVILDGATVPVWYGVGSIVSAAEAKIQYEPTPTDFDTQGSFLVGWWLISGTEQIFWPLVGYERLEIAYAPTTPPP